MGLPSNLFERNRARKSGKIGAAVVCVYLQKSLALSPPHPHHPYSAMAKSSSSLAAAAGNDHRQLPPELVPLLRNLL